MTTDIANTNAELFAALARAQGAASSLKRDRSGEHGAYTTADEISFAARQLLSAQGLAWVRVRVTLDSPALADYDIGRQAYVGDVVEEWMLVHQSGGWLEGSSRLPVIVSRGRPHDKAVGAGLTYDTGQTLRGLLCLDRDDKDGVDRREDKPREHDEPEPRAPRGPNVGPRCDSGPGLEIGEAVLMLIAELARLKGIDDIGKAWHGVLVRAGIDTAKYAGTLGGPKHLTIADGRLAKAFVEGKIAEIIAEAAADERAGAVAGAFNGSVESEVQP